MNESPNNTRRHRFLRVSLRTLLVLLTVGCVWLGWKVERARKQRAAVAWVEEMGGQVYYDCLTGDGGHLSMFDTSDPPGPWWLEELVGIDFLSHVVAVNCSGIPTLSDVSSLGDLKELESLNLHRTSVHDLSPLASFTKLSYLDVSLTAVRNLKPLESLKNLETLDVSNTTAIDLATLTTLTNLRYLSLLDTAISEEDLATVQEALPNCTIESNVRSHTD